MLSRHDLFRDHHVHIWWAILLAKEKNTALIRCKITDRVQKIDRPNDLSTPVEVLSFFVLSTGSDATVENLVGPLYFALIDETTICAHLTQPWSSCAPTVGAVASGTICSRYYDAAALLGPYIHQGIPFVSVISNIFVFMCARIFLASSFLCVAFAHYGHRILAYGQPGYLIIRQAYCRALLRKEHHRALSNATRYFLLLDC